MAATTDDLEKLSWLNKTFGVSTSNLDGLDLARDPKGEGVEERAQGLEAESRTLNIEEANRKAQAVLLPLGDLVVELHTQVGQEAAVAVTLATCVKEEAEARNHPAFSPNEPERQRYLQAKAQVALTLSALENVMEEARKAVAEEKQRRQKGMDDANNNAQAERNLLGGLVDELNTLVGGDAKAATTLATALTEDEQSRSHTDFGIDGVALKVFEQASARVSLALTALKQAILEARQAVVAEKQRRQNVTDLLDQRMQADPLSRANAVLTNLKDKDEKKPDLRMKPIRERVEQDLGVATGALSELQTSQAVPLGSFNALATQTENALNALTQAILTADDHLAARTTFRQATQTHEAVLRWGNNSKVSGEEVRLDDFRKYWKSLDKILDWTVLETHVANQLQLWVVTLGEVERDLQAWSTRKPRAAQFIQRGLDQHEQLLTLCVRLEVDPGSIGDKYPNLGQLHTLFLGREHETDQSTLDYPGSDMQLALRFLAEIELRWDSLFAPCQQELILLDEAAQLKPIVSGAIVIRWSPNLKQSEVIALLPTALGNAGSVASDIINQGAEGKTGFTVSGHEIYHSSSGSSRVSESQKGTAFWILQIEGDTTSAREIVAMGKHHGNKGDEYQIVWKASGVSAPKGNIVKLQDSKKKLS